MIDKREGAKEHEGMPSDIKGLYNAQSCPLSICRLAREKAVLGTDFKALTQKESINSIGPLAVKPSLTVHTDC